MSLRVITGAGPAGPATAPRLTAAGPAVPAGGNPARPPARSPPPS
jgi:hypothetical protein